MGTRTRASCVRLAPLQPFCSASQLDSETITIYHFAFREGTAYVGLQRKGSRASTNLPACRARHTTEGVWKDVGCVTTYPCRMLGLPGVMETEVSRSRRKQIRVRPISSRDEFCAPRWPSPPE
ncbi:uncharacterized protein LOC142775770 [Rhipicephalus microplus]|uniref:uncharacterized protein LOC142775770 n=1 Tax=Rhipicephalus microplus TaxID=6941 RepID=UPI003F6C28A1